MFEAALYVGRLGREVNLRHRDALNAVGADGTATFILGGQIAGQTPDILLVYPEGNYIRASDDRPFLQIGESKYGKFLLEMAVEANAGLVTASKIAIGSMMSTARANLAVGPPYDLAIYPANALDDRGIPDPARFHRPRPAPDDLAAPHDAGGPGHAERARPRRTRSTNRTGSRRQLTTQSALRLGMPNGSPPCRMVAVKRSPVVMVMPGRPPSGHRRRRPDCPGPVPRARRHRSRADDQPAVIPLVTEPILGRRIWVHDSP